MPGFGTARTLTFGLIFLSLLAAFSSAQGSDEGTARFSYDLGHSATGKVDGHCEGRAVKIDTARAGSLLITSDGGSLGVFDTQFNYTVVNPEAPNPQTLTTGARQTKEYRDVRPGRIQISWSGPSDVKAFEYNAFFDPYPPMFNISYRADAIRTSPAATSTDGGMYWIEKDGKIVLVKGATDGWGRFLETRNATFDVRGNLTLYVTGVRVEGPDFDVAVPYFDGKETMTPTPGVALSEKHYHHATLDLRDAMIQLSGDTARPVCRAISTHVSGTLTAYDATGEIRRGSDTVTFERRELTLVGDLRLKDKPKDVEPVGLDFAPVEAESQGRFTAMGLDHQAVAPSSASILTPANAAITAATMGAAALLWKLFTVLFTRLRQDSLLESPSRRLIYEAVQANPGITMAKLQKIVPVGSSSIRHHLKTLKAHNRVRAAKMQGRWHYFVPTSDTRALMRQILVDSDPRIGFLLSGVRAPGVPAQTILNELRAKWGLSESGGWKIIRRAVEADLVGRERIGREVILRPNS